MPTCTETFAPVLALLDEIGADPQHIDITSFGLVVHVHISDKALAMLGEMRHMEPTHRLTTGTGAHYALIVDSVHYWAALRWADMSAEMRTDAMERA